jgi:hypothetical protein
MKHCNFTAHAIDQFIARWEPNITREQAETMLQELYQTSKSVGKTPLKDTVVISPYRSEIRMVIKDRNVCVTVLPRDKSGLLKEELALLNDIEEDKEMLCILNAQEQISSLEKEEEAIDKRRSEISEQINTLTRTLRSEKNELGKRANDIHNQLALLRSSLKWKFVIK